VIPHELITDVDGAVWNKPTETKVLANKGPFETAQYKPWPFYFSDLSGTGTSLAETRGLDLCELLPTQIPEVLDYKLLTRGIPVALASQRDSNNPNNPNNPFAQRTIRSPISYTLRTDPESKAPPLTFTTTHPAFAAEQSAKSELDASLNSPFAAIFVLPTALFAYSTNVDLQLMAEAKTIDSNKTDAFNNETNASNDEFMTAGDDFDAVSATIGRSIVLQLTVTIRPLVCSGYVRVEIWEQPSQANAVSAGASEKLVFSAAIVFECNAQNASKTHTLQFLIPREFDDERLEPYEVQVHLCSCLFYLYSLPHIPFFRSFLLSHFRSFLLQASLCTSCVLNGTHDTRLSARLR
jgi:hypothetical protein